MFQAMNLMSSTRLNICFDTIVLHMKENSHFIVSLNDDINLLYLIFLIASRIISIFTTKTKQLFIFIPIVEESTLIVPVNIADNG